MVRDVIVTPSITCDAETIVGFLLLVTFAETVTEPPIANVAEGVIEPCTVAPVAVPSAL